MVNRRPVYRTCKRLFDIVFSLLVIVVLAIPVAVLCIAISLESHGNPFYSEKRIGKNGKVIAVHKLRSMVTDAGNVEKYFSDEQLAQWRSERKVDSDPRITRVGRVMRKTSVDELPQFINVLKGDMSVIGPRPITARELDNGFSPEEREELLSVRPGITGWWQVIDRNDATWENKRRQYDELYYVRHAGFAMDFYIFWSTFRVMLVKKNGR